jgi:peptidoglycan/LPS O-acetylase OafA/YrhL
MTELSQRTAPPAIATATDDGAHLYAVDLYRVVTFAAVVAQHAVIFTAPVTSPSAEAVIFLLHFTREAFFMLTAFVLVHSYLRRPLSPRRFWHRRLPLVLVPYLAWTLVYVTILAVQQGSSPLGAIGLIAHYAATGYYHLYFLVVTVQVYLIFPLLVRLLRRTRGHHQVVFDIALHASDRPHATGVLQAVVSIVLPSKSVLTYQLYVVAGALAAWHLEAFQRAISQYGRHSARAVVAVAAVSLGWYAAAVASGEPAGYAADVFQPVTVAWSLGAAVGLYTWGTHWARGLDVEHPRRLDKAIAWASDASFGVYLVHVLVLRIVIGGLNDIGVDSSWPWWARAVLACAISLPAAAGFVAVARRSRLSRELTGRPRTRA